MKNMRKTIQDLVTELMPQAGRDYKFIFDEASMVNIRVDDLRRDERFIYLEEFTHGKLDFTKIPPIKTTRIQLYFCAFSDYAAPADEREDIRESIDSEILMPFIQAYRATPAGRTVKEFTIATPPPRFDANEVSRAIFFDLPEMLCLWNQRQ